MLLSVCTEDFKSWHAHHNVAGIYQHSKWNIRVRFKSAFKLFPFLGKKRVKAFQNKLATTSGTEGFTSHYSVK